MGVMKEIYTKLLEAIPSECPYCQRDLTGLVSYEGLNELLDLIVHLVNEPTKAEKENWLKVGYEMGLRDRILERSKDAELSKVSKGA